jgi:hypothetical protein
MGALAERTAELEWANYAATHALAQVTPGLEVIVRDDVILTSSQAFPTRDTNHACLLRASPLRANDLIAEVKAYFKSRNLPVAVYVSPACTPGDLPQRLLERGFNKQEEQETWMAVEGLSRVDIPSPYPGIAVRSIARSEAIAFAEVFMAAFGMPTDFAPLMAGLLEPSVGLPGVYHYLAWNKGQAIGTCSLLCYESFGILGSAGIVSEHRRSGAATNMVVRAAIDARDLGVDTLMLQTTADTPLERLLRISGFKRAFSRTCYVLSDESPG